MTQGKNCWEAHGTKDALDLNLPLSLSNLSNKNKKTKLLSEKNNKNKSLGKNQTHILNFYYNNRKKINLK